MFVGRQRELGELENRYQRGNFEFGVIYGRRRVGKTSLLNEFSRGKKCIYFTGIESTEHQNLDRFSVAISEKLGIKGIHFDSFFEAFEYLFELAEDERLLLIIDEYPYIARTSPSLASTIQLLIDRHKATSKLFLILCGSSMSYMIDEVVAYRAPLYGRKTLEMKVEPLSYFESMEMLGDWSREDAALIYGLFGGTPLYLELAKGCKDIKDVMLSTFFNPSSIIFDEPNAFLKQEFREPAIYNAIISNIATGHTKMSEISSSTGEPTSKCAHYINNLMSLGIIEKRLPYGEKSSRRTIYSISDNMFRSWYKYVSPHYTLIQRGGAEKAYKAVEATFSDHMGKVFEDISQQYMWKIMLEGDTPMTFNSIGNWWGTNPRTRKAEEIDIMGAGSDNSAVFCECKWTNSPVDISVLNTLVERSEMFREYTKKYYYLFSKSGFGGSLKALAKKNDNIFLIDYATIYKSARIK